MSDEALTEQERAVIDEYRNTLLEHVERTNTAIERISIFAKYGFLNDALTDAELLNVQRNALIREIKRCATLLDMGNEQDA